MPDRTGREQGRSDVGHQPDLPDRSAEFRAIAEALHEMCQPLTALHCRLEIGELNGTPEAYQTAVREGLRECARLLRGVGAMRELVRSAMER